MIVFLLGPFIMPVVLTPQKLNLINKVFWERQNVLMDQRLKRRELVLVATEFLADEGRRRLPVGHRRTFEKALQDAEEAASILEGAQDRLSEKSILVEAARKAGSAPKADALGRLIKSLVARKRNLSLQELLAALEGLKGIEIIQDIGEGWVWFTNKGKHTKKVRISGLRGRLSRAKAEFRRTQSR